MADEKVTDPQLLNALKSAPATAALTPEKTTLPFATPSPDEKVTDPKILEALRAPKSRTIGGAAYEAVGNIPQSATQFAAATIQPLLDPIGTGKSIGNIGKGVLQHLGLVSGEDAQKYSDAVGQFLVDRYGGWDQVKNTLATDPVGLAGDLSLFLSLGGGIAARAPGIIGKTGEIASTAGRVVDPLTSAVQGAKLGIKAGEYISGEYLTHATKKALDVAAQAGRESVQGAKGAEGAEKFLGQMRQTADPLEAAQSARQGLEGLRAERGKAYASGMVEVGKDATELNFAKVDQALQDIEKIQKFKAESLETADEAAIRTRMINKIEHWKTLDPAEYRTPLGFDALKRSLGKIYRETDAKTPSRKVAGTIYNAVKDTIVDQAPTYAKIMEGYEEAENLIGELERQLVGKPETSLGPALKKLQKIMMNNVHTNWGSNERLAQVLVDNGATHMIKQLAGQALSATAPRGFGRVAGETGLLGGVGAALLGHPAVLAGTLITLGLSSPRVMGEAAFYAGKFYGWSQKYNPVPSWLTEQLLFQAGRLKTPLEMVASSHDIVRRIQTEATAEPSPPPTQVARFDAFGNPLAAQ